MGACRFRFHFGNNHNPLSVYSAHPAGRFVGRGERRQGATLRGRHRLRREFFVLYFEFVGPRQGHGCVAGNTALYRAGHPRRVRHRHDRPHAPLPLRTLGVRLRVAFQGIAGRTRHTSPTDSKRRRAFRLRQRHRHGLGAGYRVDPLRRSDHGLGDRPCGGKQRRRGSRRHYPRVRRRNGHCHAVRHARRQP